MEIWFKIFDLDHFYDLPLALQDCSGMMKARFVVFRQRRYGFKKILSKNIVWEKSYDLLTFKDFNIY